MCKQLKVHALRGDYTIVETDDKVLANIPQILLPDGVREGDVIELRIRWNIPAEE